MYLGVDGGGTKTAFAVIDAHGVLLAQHEEGTCSYSEIGMEAAQQLLRRGTQTVLALAGLSECDLQYAFFGLPCYGEDSRLIETLDALPSAFLDRARYRCDNDMLCGWAAAFDGDDGINIVSGTGSIAYGVRQGVSARCGGWGELFSDEGSAWWIGRRGLTAFTQMSDGRLARGPLYSLLKEALNIEQDYDIIERVCVDWQSERSRIASIATWVSQAADAGDVHAAAIFDRAGVELARIVDGARQALGFHADEQVPVSYSGGVFNTGSLVLAPFQRELAKRSPHYHIVGPLFTPVLGAARYARLLSQTQC